MKTSNLIFFISVAFSILLAACSDDKNDDIDVSGISILNGNDTIYLDKDSTYQLKFKTDPADQAIAFYCSNNQVANVTKDGTVKAIGPGIASIYAVSLNGTKRAQTSCVVNVLSHIKSISVSDEYVMVSIDSPLDVSSLFFIYPLNATNTRLIYKSTDTNIATIDKDGIITSVGKGVVNIVAMPADGKEGVVSAPLKVYSNYSAVELSKTGWTAVASEQYSSGYGASKIIDGSTTSFWHNDISKVSNPPWSLMVDMKEEKTFNKISIWRRNGYTDTRTVDIYISGKTEDGVELTDTSFEKIGSIDFADANEWINSLSLDFWMDSKNYKSRYIKLVLPNTNRSGNNSLCEISLYNVG